MAKDYLPASKARQLFEDIAIIKQALVIRNMINEREAAELLNIKIETLRIKFSRNQIPEDCYTISPVNGERFYHKDRILGLKKQAIWITLRFQ